LARYNRDMDTPDQTERLLSVLCELNHVVVAFSGGVDSAVVAAAAVRVLGSKARAVTGDSASVPRAELEAAIRLAKHIGIAHRLVKTDEFADPDYLKNDGSRCYFCKSELYGSIAVEPGEAIVSGANLDDRGDYRPGLTAAAERGVRHPLQEAGFTKADVRRLAREWDLPVADKPASPCLSSRVVPGLAVTPERLGRIEAAEAYLKSLGVIDCRVRYHEGDLARVELPTAELARFLESVARERLTAKLRELGFRFVTLDLDGLRSGSLNALIPLTVKSRFPAGDVA